MNSYSPRDKSNVVNTTKNNYAFIDAHNLYRSSLHWGWKLDYSKFLKFLQIKYSITTAYLFMGYRSENNEAYINLQKQGYILVFKDTTEKEEEIKGNSDVELVLQALVEVNHYDKAVIVTGDGDFGALVRYLNSVDKLEVLLVPSDTFVPSILKRTAREKISYLNNLKSELASHNFHYNASNSLPNLNSNFETRKSLNHGGVRRLNYASNNTNVTSSLKIINPLQASILEPKVLQTEVRDDDKIVDKKTQLLEAVKQAKLKFQENIETQKIVEKNQLIQTIKPETVTTKISDERLEIPKKIITKPALKTEKVTFVAMEDATKKIQNIVDDLINSASATNQSLDKIEKKVYKPRLKKKQQIGTLVNDSDEDTKKSKPEIHLD